MFSIDPNLISLSRTRLTCDHVQLKGVWLTDAIMHQWRIYGGGGGGGGHPLFLALGGAKSSMEAL